MDKLNQDELERRLTLALALRLQLGSFAYVIAMALIAAFTPLGTNFPVFSYLGCFLGAAAACWRYWSAAGAVRNPDRCLADWRPQIFRSAVSLGLCWALFLCVGLWTSFGDRTEVLFVIASVGFVSATCTGMGEARGLCLILIAMQMLPVTLWSYFAMAHLGPAIVGLNLVYVVFSLAITGIHSNKVRGMHQVQILLEERGTDLQNTAKALRSAKELAEQASLAQERFLANMSHEIRTPLNGVIGLTEVLSSTSTNPDQQEIIRNIQTSGEHLLAILNDILDVSKINAGKMAVEQVPLDLAALIHSVVGSFKALAAAKGLQLTLDVAAVPSLATGDPVRIRQVLTNLLSNAIKFTDKGGVALIASVSRPGWIRFSIADTGIGVSPEQASKLFADFAQADASTTRRFGGTGLGLAICKRLVELMEGTIGVETGPEQGSTFWFELPFSAVRGGEKETGTNSPSLATPRFRPQTRILLAEDNAVNRMVCERLLKPMGAQIDIAENGRIAVEKHTLAPYDIILMDCNMPEMDGFQATAAIRALAGALSAVPIIAVSANAFDEDRERCLKAGMNHHVSKPVRRDQLLQAINQYLD